MMQDSVGKIWQLENLPFLRLENCKNMIFGRSERPILQTIMQRQDVLFPVFVVKLHAIRAQFPLACLFIGKP